MTRVNRRLHLPALTTRPFGVAVRPTLQCGERGPRRLSELAAQDSNRGHALVLECGAQWALRGTLRARHGPLQSVAPDGGAFERSLLDVQLRDARPIPRSIPSGCPTAVWEPSRLDA